jgi:hypothetical protein
VAYDVREEKEREEGSVYQKNENNVSCTNQIFFVQSYSFDIQFVLLFHSLQLNKWEKNIERDRERE